MATLRPRAKLRQAEAPPGQFFLGRQPIVGRNRELVAYELLFRAGNYDTAGVVDDFAATATVIETAFTSLGIERALGDRKGFINVNEDVLMSDLVELLPPNRVVLEILEHVELTADLVERCRQLKAAGYSLALDDVISLEAEHQALLDCVEIVKFDINVLGMRQLIDLVQEVRHREVRTLAEKVETVEQYEDCKSIGFDLFQGYFFARPVVLSGRVVQPAKMTLIRILRLLANEADNDALEAVLKEAPDLAVRMLKMASSVACEQVRRVTSIRSAISLLGRMQIGRLVQLMLIAQQVGGDLGSDPLVQTAAIRGRLMESLAVFHGFSNLREEAFTVGILSLADSLFGQSMNELLDMLNLDESLRQALINHEGDLGRLLTLVEASEGADRDSLASMSKILGTGNAMVFNRMQVEALRWASAL
ncbi:MAG TPA: EAL domain-containing protein [Acidisoma sp.]|nr:EAL domain-containing protein [Acidisoma sp.]